MSLFFRQQKIVCAFIVLRNLVVSLLSLIGRSGFYTRSLSDLEGVWLEGGVRRGEECR